MVCTLTRPNILQLHNNGTNFHFFVQPQYSTNHDNNNNNEKQETFS